MAPLWRLICVHSQTAEGSIECPQRTLPPEKRYVLRYPSPLLSITPICSQDVPKLARPGAFIVNCAIAPLVSLGAWPYRLGGGLGGSGAHALLSGRDGVAAELELGVGWQVLERGLRALAGLWQCWELMRALDLHGGARVKTAACAHSAARACSLPCRPPYQRLRHA